MLWMIFILYVLHLKKDHISIHHHWTDHQSRATCMTMLPTALRTGKKKKTDDNNMYFLHWRGECTFMSFSNGEFLTIIDLPEGTHQYRFYVDGNWAYEQSEVKFWSLHTSYYAINLRFSSLFRICYACCFTEWLNNVCIWKEKLICCVMRVKNNSTSTLTCRKFSI